MILRRVAPVIALFGAGLSVAGATSPSVARIEIGNFFAAPDGPVIAIADCGEGKLCGRIVGLGKLPPTDARNPKAAEKGRNLCGLQVLTLSVARDATPNEKFWEGRFYHAEKGQTYNVLVSVMQNEYISIGGAVGDPFLSRTFPFQQFWETAVPNYVACTAPVS